MDFPLSVIFFGRSGEGKSTLANMLIQPDLYFENNSFRISDGAIGETSKITFAHNKTFIVYDTIGLCETSKGNVSNKNALREIKNYFSKVHDPLNFICYVIKKGRLTQEHKVTFNVFKEIFAGGETNFAIVITNCETDWVQENIVNIREYFGNSPIIGVDFPISNSSNETKQHFERTTRHDNRKRLISFFIDNHFKGVKLDILEYAPLLEKRLEKIISFTHLIGSTYD